MYEQANAQKASNFMAQPSDERVRNTPGSLIPMGFRWKYCSKAARGLGVVALSLVFWSIHSPANAQGALVEVATLTPINGVEGDTFGSSVDLESRTLVVGARWDSEVAYQAGAAFVFEQQPNGEWLEVAKLVDAAGQRIDLFGQAVAVSGGLVAVGSPRDDDLGNDSGSVSIFERTASGQWQWTQTLYAEEESEGGNFGGSVALDEQLLVVGAPRLEASAGAAYVFERSPAGRFELSAQLTASDGQPGAEFGDAVSTSRGRIAIGALDATNTGSGKGAAYLFSRKAQGNFFEEARLYPSDDEPFDFASSLSLSGDRLAVLGLVEVDRFERRSSAYVFEFTQDRWQEVVRVDSLDGATTNRFEGAVDLAGERLALGVPFDDSERPDGGRVVLYKRTPSGFWQEEEEVFPQTAYAFGRFGAAVALTAHGLAVGAPGAERETGRVGIFEPTGVHPQLVLSGTCSDGIELRVSGGTPLSRVGLFGSRFLGSGQVGSQCEGTLLGIEEPRPLLLGLADADGNAFIERELKESWCGTFLQLLDLETCLVSEVVPVPAPLPE